EVVQGASVSVRVGAGPATPAKTMSLCHQPFAPSPLRPRLHPREPSPAPALTVQLQPQQSPPPHTTPLPASSPHPGVPQDQPLLFTPPRQFAKPSSPMPTPFSSPVFGQRPNIRPVTFFQTNSPSAPGPHRLPGLQAVMREECEDEDKNEVEGKNKDEDNQNNEDNDEGEGKDKEHKRELKAPFNGFAPDGRTPKFCQGIYYSMCILRPFLLCFDDEIVPLDEDDNPVNYTSHQIDHMQTDKWIFMPAGYHTSQWVEDDVLMCQPDNELPSPTKGKEFVFCYEDSINGCIYYTGEFVEGKWEAWEKHSKWARYNSNQWYSSPNGLQAPRPPGITVPLVDDSSDSGSSYGRTARATRLDEEMTAACQKKKSTSHHRRNDVIPDEEPLTPRINKGKGRAFEEHEENDEDMQDIETGREGDHTENSDDEIIASPSRRRKGGRMPNAGLKACSDFGNKTRADADKLARCYNCKRQSVMLKAGLHVASAHGDHIYNDFKTWNSLQGTEFPEEFVEGEDPVKAWTRGITKLYHEQIDGLPAPEKLAMHQSLLADITVWGGQDSNTMVKRGHRALVQFSNLSTAFSQVYNVEVIGLVIPISSNPMAAQMAGVFYGSEAIEGLLSDAKVPLDKLIHLMITAIKSRLAGSDFDGSMFLSQLWPELSDGLNASKDTQTTTVTGSTCGEPNMDDRVTRPLPNKKDNNIHKPKIATMKSKKQEVITILDTESVKLGPKQKKKKTANEGPKDNNWGMVSTFWHNMQNEINGVVKGQASFKTFAADLEVAKKNPHRISAPQEKSYRKGTAEYEGIPIIKMGEGSVGPSITITTTLDTKMNHEAYALQHGKAVPIESDHESDHKGNHSSIVDHNERPIAPLPSQPPPSWQMGTHSNTKKCRHVDSGSDNEATPKKVLRQKEADAKDDVEQDADEETTWEGIVPYLIDDTPGPWNDSDGAPLPEIGLLPNNDVYLPAPRDTHDVYQNQHDWLTGYDASF
ncbi:hypothetical protein DXG01_004205, partial [Tephrocybe rancida]